MEFITRKKLGTGNWELGACNGLRGFFRPLVPSSQFPVLITFVFALFLFSARAAQADGCSDSAASLQTSTPISGLCQASCNSTQYDATVKTLFSSNPCASEATKKKCCLSAGTALCQYLAKTKAKVTEKVNCQNPPTAKYSKELSGTAGSCGGTTSKCVQELPGCMEAVSQLGQNSQATCAYSKKDAESVDTIYSNAFDATDILKLAKATYSCPSDTKCIVSVGSSQNFWCDKLGKLNGVKDATCAKSLNYSTCDDLAKDPSGKYAGFKQLVTSEDADPCGNFRPCCAPPVTAGKPGAGSAAMSTKQTKQVPPVTITKFGLVNPLGSRSVPQIIGQVVQFLGVLAGSLFFGFLIWGGIQWMTAGGDATKVKAAQQRIVASIMGITVVLLAYLLVESLTGVLGFK